MRYGIRISATYTALIIFLKDAHAASDIICKRKALADELRPGWHVFFDLKTSSPFPPTTPPPTSAVIELHYMALWGSHYSLWLICNDWLSSTSQAKMDSHIDYT